MCTVLYKKLRQIYEDANQQHVFTFYEELTEEEKQNLLLQLSAIDIHKFCNEFKNSLQSLSEISKKYKYFPPEKVNFKSFEESEIQKILQFVKTDNFKFVQPLFSSLSPVLLSDLSQTQDKLKEEWRTIGYQKVLESKIAVIIMAGGDGSRLNFSGPKGCMKVSPLSRKSLFEIFCERLLRVQTLAKNFIIKKGGNKKIEEYKSIIPLYIMTSTKNSNAIINFFEQNNYFNLEKENVRFFTQGQTPCFTEDGKLILKNKSEVSESPNGNGGVFEALRNSECFYDMKKKNIEAVHIVGVDNLLCKVADCVFVGYHFFTNADISVKCVEKKHKDEKVGLLCARVVQEEKDVSNNANSSIGNNFNAKKNNNDNNDNTSRNYKNTRNKLCSTGNNDTIGDMLDEENPELLRKDEKAFNKSALEACIAEYSELNEEIKSILDSNNKFIYNAGNIASHFFSFNFIKNILDEHLMVDNYHLAHKCIPYIDIDMRKLDDNEKNQSNINAQSYNHRNAENSNSIKNNKENLFLINPTQPNAYKLELFIFDCFKYAKSVAGLLVKREEEFAPIKTGGDGEDSVHTAITMMSLLHQKWLLDIGVSFKDNQIADNKSENNKCEIAPKVSYEGENLKEIFKNKSKILNLPYMLDFP